MNDSLSLINDQGLLICYSQVRKLLIWAKTKLGRFESFSELIRESLSLYQRSEFTNSINRDHDEPYARV